MRKREQRGERSDTETKKKYRKERGLDEKEEGEVKRTSCRIKGDRKVLKRGRRRGKRRLFVSFMSEEREKGSRKGKRDIQACKRKEERKGRKKKIGVTRDGR